jgi:pyridoxamine 5'-phosphate oxidase
MSSKQRYGRDREYLAGALHEQDAKPDPLEQFLIWLDDAMRSGMPDPTAMALATADAEGRPSVRMVLMKDAGVEGITFFSNYRSKKGMDLTVNPQAAIVFFWPALDRQVRVEGRVEKTSKAVSDAFFESRPRGSKLASVISPQSAAIPGREYLEEKFNVMAGNDIDPVRPDHWGGYILKPEIYEFWQGRANRMNDRIQYVQDGGAWKIRRLAP